MPFAAASITSGTDICMNSCAAGHGAAVSVALAQGRGHPWRARARACGARVLQDDLPDVTIWHSETFATHGHSGQTPLKVGASVPLMRLEISAIFSGSFPRPCWTACCKKPTSVPNRLRSFA